MGAAAIAQVHRARTTEGKDVAIKVLRPGIREQFARDIETYEWAAAHLEALGGEAARLRPQLVIANLKRWTLRELDLRREAASASELKDAMVAVEGYNIPPLDTYEPHYHSSDDNTHVLLNLTTKKISIDTSSSAKQKK